jgi:hypothetical protein
MEYDWPYAIKEALIAKNRTNNAECGMRNAECGMRFHGVIFLSKLGGFAFYYIKTRLSFENLTFPIRKTTKNAVSSLA